MLPVWVEAMVKRQGYMEESALHLIGRFQLTLEEGR